MMDLVTYLLENTDLGAKEAREVAFLAEEYRRKYRRDGTPRQKLNIRVPHYTKGEELANSLSHGIAAALSVVALVLMTVKARGALAEATVSLFGATMILLYTISCIYHALPPRLEGKKVFRVIDHCNVFLLVFGTYIPFSLMAIGGWKGWLQFSLVAAATFIGITLSAVSLDRFTVSEVICDIVSGWSALLFIPELRASLGPAGLAWLIAGGVMYTVGSILYGVGSKKKYVHSIFHLFCIAGTFCHFWSIYMYLL